MNEAFRQALEAAKAKIEKEKEDKETDAANRRRHEAKDVEDRQKVEEVIKEMTSTALSQGWHPSFSAQLRGAVLYLGNRSVPTPEIEIKRIGNDTIEMSGFFGKEEPLTARVNNKTEMDKLWARLAEEVVRLNNYS